MSAFELIELRFDPEDAKPTIEDEFTMTMVAKDIEKLDDPEDLKLCSKHIFLDLSKIFPTYVSELTIMVRCTIYGTTKCNY